MRTSNMNSIDDELAALSLGDIHLSHHHETDAMEVDSTLELEFSQADVEPEIADENNKLTPIKQDQFLQSTPEPEPEVYSDPETSTFVSALAQRLFAPTTIGAKVALNKRLLPPPETERALVSVSSTPTPTVRDFDHEYDLSASFNLNRFQVRHINSFSSASDNSVFLEKTPEFVYNPATKDFDHEHTYAGSASPANASVNYRPWDLRQRNAVVHHHHYYYTPTKDDTVNSIYASPVSQLHTRFINDDDVELPPPWKLEKKPPHERMPYIISSYLQLVINFSVVAYGLYLVYGMISSIRTDINNKLAQYSSNVLIEIETCRRSYFENNCSPDVIVPAMAKPCEYYEKCMNQNPFDTGKRASISAETVGVILNSLIEPLGFKFFVALIMFIGVVFGSNFTFGYIRAKLFYGWDPERNLKYAAVKSI